MNGNSISQMTILITRISRLTTLGLRIYLRVATNMVDSSIKVLELWIQEVVKTGSTTNCMMLKEKIEKRLIKMF